MSLGRLAATTFLTGEKSRASPVGSTRKTFLGDSRSTPLCSQASYSKSKSLFCSLVGSHTDMDSGERRGVIGNNSGVSTGAVIGIWWLSRRWFLSIYLRDSGQVNAHSLTVHVSFGPWWSRMVSLQLPNSVIGGTTPHTTKYLVTTGKIKQFISIVVDKQIS